MSNVCKESGWDCSVCSLTASTGLSLAESVAHYAEVDGLVGTEQLVSKATSFFSYSWNGTALVDMLDALDEIIAKLESQPNAEKRFVWSTRLLTELGNSSSRVLLSCGLLPCAPPVCSSRVGSSRVLL